MQEPLNRTSARFGSVLDSTGACFGQCAINSAIARQDVTVLLVIFVGLITWWIRCCVMALHELLRLGGRQSVLHGDHSKIRKEQVSDTDIGRYWLQVAFLKSDIDYTESIVFDCDCLL